MYNSLKQDFSIIFESLADHLKAQKGEADKLRRELQEANQRAMDADEQAASRLEAVLEEERREAEAERCALLTQIGRLVNEMGEKQAARVEKKVQDMQGDMKRTRSAMREADTRYGQGMDKWAREQDNFLAHVVESETKLSRQIDSNLTVSAPVTARGQYPPLTILDF
jgi:kinesin family protein 11